jgi:eukaryotic-like serine/threonine-protein kinase
VRSSGPVKQRPITSVVVVSSESAKSPGQRFGRFRLLERIEGEGAAEVYRALRSAIAGGEAGLCVVKRLRTELCSSPAFARMFSEEARIMALLQHPNIVRTIEQGEEAGTPYQAMEHLDGLSLAKTTLGLRSTGMKMPIEAALGIARDLAKAATLMAG